MVYESIRCSMHVCGVTVITLDGTPPSLLAEHTTPFALVQSLVVVAYTLSFPASAATSPQPKQPRSVCLTQGLE